MSRFDLNDQTRYALLSVSDKTGIVEFARELIALNYQILSTGGTASLLAKEGVSVIAVEDHIQFPEILDGRVKTLNPKIHGGILAQRNNPEHMQTLAMHDISLIDIVAVNLYPFAQTIAKDGVSLEEAIEQIDIGGPTMVRASAKNHADIYSVVNPNDYPRVIELLKAIKAGQKTADQAKAFRFELACASFAHTAMYDGMISQYLAQILAKNNNQTTTADQVEFAQTLHLSFEKVQDLRYGENPHQQAAFYRNPQASNSFANYELIQGKELSYNNLADADAAWQAVKAFNHFQSEEKTACVIVKHANPCGVALGQTTLAAYEKALLTDKTSAFGGIIAFNQKLDAQAVAVIMQQFLEVLIAPEYTPEALTLLQAKPNVRVLKVAINQLALAT
jgi:phosphoribosylaminoimidazolecarboxamide formyltransferase / IMP cyclohydrolase